MFNEWTREGLKVCLFQPLLLYDTICVLKTGLLECETPGEVEGASCAEPGK